MNNKPYTIIGRKNIDDFCVKFSDGRVLPWPTEEERKDFEKKYPMPPQEEIDRIKKETEQYFSEKRRTIPYYNDYLYMVDEVILLRKLFNKLIEENRITKEEETHIKTKQKEYKNNFEKHNKQ